MLFAFILALLGFPPAPPAGEPYQPGPNGPQTAEQAAQYEAEYSSCDGTWNPDQCRADVARKYGYA
jgi:hypothetical protein